MTNYPASFAPYVQDNAGFPGAQPNGTQMQGNPQVPSNLPAQNLPGNQNAVQQLTGTQISAGNISANSVPTNVLSAPGTDSLLAQMARGQVIMADSTYGQGGFVPGNAGAGQPPGAPIATPVTARVASTLTYPAAGSAQNYTGN
jgi:hypothetical protein